jgi:hypothetical protein
MAVVLVSAVGSAALGYYYLGKADHTFGNRRAN